MSPQIREPRGLPWKVLFVYGSLALGICVTGYVFYLRQQVASRNDKAEELSAIADLKVEEIVHWRHDRLAHAQLVLDDQERARRFRELLKQPAAAPLKEEVLQWMRLLREDFHYATVLFVDTTLTVIQAYPPVGNAVGPQTAMYAREALKTRKEVFSGFYRDEATQYIQLDLVIPLLIGTATSSPKEPVGAIILRIDPYQSIYPLLQSWPTPSQRSEVSLVRKEGNDVVFLNDLRFREHTALALRFPVSEDQLPEAMAVRGQTGVVEGLDYRHTRVLAAIRMIEDSPWYLVAKTDLDEVEAPVRARGWMIAVIVGLMILAAGSVAVTLWWNERAKYFRKHYELELEREALLQHFEYITKYANDIILLKDSEGNIIEQNDRALKEYGYSRTEMMGINIRDLRAPEAIASVADDMKHIRESNGLLFETVHRRKDGTTFPVEVSSRAITIDKVTFYQSIIRDITERKQTERKILKFNSLYAVLSKINDAIFRIHDEQTLFDEVCTVAVNDGNFSMAWIGVVDGGTHSLRVAALHGVMKKDDLIRWLTAEDASGAGGQMMTTLLQGHRVIYDNVGDSGQPPQWEADALKYGFRSVAVFPLQISNALYAALGLHLQGVNYFDEAKVRLLEGMAGNLSSAVEFMHVRRRDQAASGH